MTMDTDTTITVIPDPCWTLQDEAAAQVWLALIAAAADRTGTVHAE